MLLTIVTFIIVLGVLVFVHELGHFLVAKKSGMLVEEFGFGFPPRLAGIQKINGKFKFVLGHKQPLNTERTVYSINWIPLGGFVKILGENNEHEHNPRSFINRPFWARLATLVAGVVMNFILAWFLLSVGFIYGLPVAVDSINDLPYGAQIKNSKVVILEVDKNQPGALAGLSAGDSLISIDGNKFSSTAEARNYIRSNAGKVFEFYVNSNGNEKNLKVASLKSPGPDQGPTGIALGTVGTMSFPWYLAPYSGLKASVIQIEQIGQGLYQLISGHADLKNLGGPVKIAQLTGQVSRMGFLYLMQFTALLSLNLALLNILPFPALDGGRVLFLIIEKLRGKRNNQKIEQWVNAIGFAVLLLLMVLVTTHDVIGLIHK